MVDEYFLVRATLKQLQISSKSSQLSVTIEVYKHELLNIFHQVLAPCASVEVESSTVVSAQ